MKYFGCILIGFTLGVFTTVGVALLVSGSSPKLPVLANPESIVVYLHPWGGYEACTTKAVQIPSERQEEVFRRLVPGTYHGNINEKVSPLVAEAVITHSDKTETRVLIREGGVNPAIVSVDGVSYFYAKNEPDVYAGANEIIKLVAEVVHNEQMRASAE